MTRSRSASPAPAARKAAPPGSRLPLLPRPRLLEVLDGRFSRRVTLLIAGAGFGKTALLDQALAAARTRDDVVDLFLRCRSGDRFASGFRDALSAAVGVPRSARAGAEAIADAIWQKSPVEVALVLDDAHHLEEGSRGAELLAELLEVMPRNGHLVLAGRADAPLPVSRLLAQGEAVRIDEQRFAFDEAEQEAFAALRGVDPAALRGAGGWPTVLELRARVGEAQAEDFLWEEVLAGLGAERTRALARLSPLVSFDDELVRAVTGLDLGALDLVAGLPLVHIDTTGAVRLHRLWRPILARIKESEDVDARRHAAQVLCARGDLVAAVDLCLDAEDDELLRQQLREIAVSSALALPQDVLAALLDRLPQVLLAEPSGQLLLAAQQVVRQPARARQALARAEQSYADAADERGIAACLTAQMQVAFWAADAASLRAAIDRIDAIDKTARETLGAQIGRASLALLEGRPLAAIELLEPVRSSVEPGLALLANTIAVVAALDAGLPARGLAERELADVRSSPRIRGIIAAAEIEARWWLGRLAAADLDRAAEGIDGVPAGGRHNLAVNAAVLAQMNAALGRRREGRQLLARAEELAPVVEGPRPAATRALASAALDVLDGEEDRAAQTLRSLLAEHPLGERPLRNHRRGLGLFQVLLPEARETIDRLTPGDCYAAARDVGRALVALREDADARPAAGLDWTEPRILAAALVAPLVIELAVAALAEGIENARLAIEALVPDPRPALRRIAERYDGKIASTARALLTGWPVRPEHAVCVGVLGPLELHRAEDPPTAITPRRERVRALLLYLIENPDTTRDAVGAALWPDLDEESVTNNLRVTLNHLNRCLEPEREAGEPAWFVRSEDGRLQLHRDDTLRVDAWELDRLSEEAQGAEAQGAVRRALALYQEATEQWRGDYLCDAPDPEWGEAERTRLRSRFVRSAVRAGELLLAQDQADRALDLAQRAARADEFAEAPQRLQVLAYHGLRDRPAARRALSGFLARLEREGLQPEPKTQRLAKRLGLG